MISCATGHRPNKLGGYSVELSKLRIDLAVKWFDEHPDITEHVQGMALGWDQDTAEAAFIVGLPVIAALPFRGQELCWPLASRRKYDEILTNCAEVFIVSAGAYAAWKMQKRNEWMVDKSDIVLALHDGSPGGTANCMKYAREYDVPTDNLWAEYQRLLNANGCT